MISIYPRGRGSSKRLGNFSNVAQLVLSPGLATRDKSASSVSSFPPRLLSGLPEAAVLQFYPCAGPLGSRHLSDEPEPHCSLRRPCRPGTLHSLYLCGHCLSTPLPRPSAPIQLTHPSRAGVNQSWGLIEPAGSPHTVTKLLPCPQPGARSRVCDRDRHRPRPCPQSSREAGDDTTN